MFGRCSDLSFISRKVFQLFTAYMKVFFYRKLPDFRKGIAFWKVLRLRPFLHLKTASRWSVLLSKRPASSVTWVVWKIQFNDREHNMETVISSNKTNVVFVNKSVQVHSIPPSPFSKHVYTNAARGPRTSPCELCGPPLGWRWPAMT